jgi:transposase
MAHISGHDRSQVLLLPEAVDDYVGTDNPVRFIDAFVDGLDLAAAGFARVAPEATGRPGYAPGDLLKLYIYGYLNRVRSSRRLEAETHRNIEVIWLLRHLKPDFKTIADFRRDNRGAFRSVFRQFVVLCRRLDLYGRELLAVDGTRIKAVNNKDRNFTRNSLETFRCICCNRAATMRSSVKKRRATSTRHARRPAPISPPPMLSLATASTPPRNLPQSES